MQINYINNILYYYYTSIFFCSYIKIIHTQTQRLHISFVKLNKIYAIQSGLINFDAIFKNNEVTLK